MAKQQHARPAGRIPRDLGTTLTATGQSPMVTASADRPFKPYVWRGVPGPVIGAPGWTAAQLELAEEDRSGD